MSAPILLLMGVSGSGKSTLAEELVHRLGWRMQEGDALHPPANVAKMARGEALTDEDRAPWLDAIGRVIDGWRAAGRAGIVTCSALKRAYRDRLRAGRPELVFVYLHGEKQLIHDRLAHRRGHFMPAALLDSQIATLEAPAADEHAISLAVDRPPAALATELLDSLTHQHDGRI